MKCWSYWEWECLYLSWAMALPWAFSGYLWAWDQIATFQKPSIRLDCFFTDCVSYYESLPRIFGIFCKLPSFRSFCFFYCCYWLLNYHGIVTMSHVSLKWQCLDGSVDSGVARSMIRRSFAKKHLCPSKQLWLKLLSLPQMRRFSPLNIRV